jgi:hypothetical protein
MLKNNTIIKVTPTTSAKIQEIAFECGYDWCNGTKTPRHLDGAYLLVRNTSLYYSDNEYFNEANIPGDVVTAESVIFLYNLK